MDKCTRVFKIDNLNRMFLFMVTTKNGTDYVELAEVKTDAEGNVTVEELSPADKRLVVMYIKAIGGAE